MNIRHIRIGQRLMLGFGLVIALLMLLAGVAMLRINSLNSEIGSMVNETYPRTVIANKMKADLNDISRSMLSILVMSDADQMKGEVANIEKVTKRNDENLALLKRSVDDPEGLALIKTIVELRERSLKHQAAFINLINTDEKDNAMTKYLFSIRSLQTKYFAALDKLIALQNQHMEAAGANSAQQARSTALFILVLALAATGISVFVALLAT
ncbi:MAG: MCP four helix bundle domain-containing protein, partial [Aquabacterium sp.]|nr:MCP four helix bundle domain-containing protein [Aquabacterium sp.]